jgi:ATP-binding protein involved in chromosome partitioning
MPLSETQIVEALRAVMDPELNRSIIELDMVKGVDIDGGRVKVTVALTVAGCPMREEITQRVTDALLPVTGVDRVDVELTVMSPEQLAGLRRSLGGHATPGQGQGPPIPFSEPESRTRVIGIASGKGGVGKSSVTVNLAIALRKLGHEVGILDADVYGFSIPRMLGVEAQPTIIGEGEDRIIVPAQAHGVRCISMGFFLEEDQAAIWRGPMLHKALRQFLTDFWWGDPDYLLIDMPPGTGDVALSMAQYLPRSEFLVVTTPQPAAQSVAQRTGALAKEVRLPVRGVIENMSWFTADDGTRYELFGSGGGELLSEKLGAPLLGKVPLVPALREGGDVGRPITISDPDGEPAQAFAAIAKAVAAQGPARVYKRELQVS